MRTAAVIGMVIGIGLGLLGGWVIWPVEYADITPELLTVEYQTEYALMIATAYAADGDLELAHNRLARLGNSAAAAVLNAFIIADGDEVALAGLQKLAVEMELHATMPTPTE